MSPSSHSDSTLSELPRVAALSKPLRSPSPKDSNGSSRPLLLDHEVSEQDRYALLSSPTATTAATCNSARAKSAESLSCSSPISLFSSLTGPAASSASSFLSARPTLKSLDRQAKKFLASYHAALRSCRPFSTFLSTAVDEAHEPERSLLSVSPVSQPLVPRSCLSPYPHAEAVEGLWMHPTLLAASQGPPSQATPTGPGPLAASSQSLTLPTWKLCLHPGAVFSGIQQSNQRQYEVHVQIQHVVLEESYLCGYLNIKGLTFVW